MGDFHMLEDYDGVFLFDLESFDMANEASLSQSRTVFAYLYIDLDFRRVLFRRSHRITPGGRRSRSDEPNPMSAVFLL